MNTLPERESGAGVPSPTPSPSTAGMSTASPSTIAPETLMRYIDGEMPPEERAAVEAVLAHSTELQRDIALFSSMHEDLSSLRFRPVTLRNTVWTRVNDRLTRPIGWILLVIGTVGWLVYGLWLYLSSATPTWEKLLTSAILIGVLLLFASVIHDRYREWLTDPYRHVER
jgi:ABC-type multidrug transport system fused ATPase/permease subunit